MNESTWNCLQTICDRKLQSAESGVVYYFEDFDITIDIFPFTNLFFKRHFQVQHFLHLKSDV